MPPFFMATVRRFSYSLLVSTLVFAVFTVVAFSGVFPWVEAQFFSPKVVADFQDRLDKAEQTRADWEASLASDVQKLMDEGGFAGVFAPTASKQTLQQRFTAAKLYLLGRSGGGRLRIVDATRTQIHFSTEDGDVKAKTDTSLTYRLVAELTGLPSLAGVPVDGKAHALDTLDGKGLEFVLPWTDAVAKTSGSVLLGVSFEDLRQYSLTRSTALGDLSPVSVGTSQYLYSLLGRATDAAVLGRVKQLASDHKLPPVQRLATTEGGPEVALIHRGSSLLLVPAEALQLNPVLKALLLASLYTVVFLVVFLLANLRGEPLSVVTRKVKRFQLQVVKQYLDLKAQDRVQSLRDELNRHSDEIRADVRRSVGRVRRQDREQVDRFIDTSWQEVMDMLRGPAPPAGPGPDADWKRLETLLQQALTQGRFVVSGAPVAEAPSPLRKAPVPQAPADDVEELDEVEELEDVDEVEDLDEAEVQDAEPVEAEELDDVEELDDLEEVEADDDTSPVEEEAELVEEPDEAEEVLDELEEEDPEEALPISEDVDELEELEEVDLAEPAGGVDDLEPLDDGEPFYRSRGVTPPEEAPMMLPISADDEGDLESLEELEDAEELEAEAEGTDLSFPLERLDAAWGRSTGGVFDESEGVVQLSDEVFSEVPAADDDFGRLVDSVLSGPEGTDFVPLEKEDLVPQMVARDWRWTGGGFDWDRFAQSPDEVGLFRALSDLVTELDAFTAAILVDDGSGTWTLQSSVGFSDSGKEMLRFTPDSPLVRQFLNIQALHMLQGGGTHPVLRTAFHPKDLKFLRTVVLVPLLFRHQPAWLMLGVRKDLADPIGLLAPRRIG